MRCFGSGGKLGHISDDYTVINGRDAAIFFVDPTTAPTQRTTPVPVNPEAPDIPDLHHQTYSPTVPPVTPLRTPTRCKSFYSYSSTSLSSAHG